VAQCGEKFLINAFQAKSLIDIGDCSALFGAFFGLLIAQRFTPRIISGRVVEDTWTSFLTRIILAFGVTYPWRLMGTLVTQAKIKNVYVNLWFGTLISGLLQGFFLFFVADLLSYYLGLLKMQTTKAKSDQD